MSVGEDTATERAFKEQAGAFVDAGIAPAADADRVVAAIRDNDFWIVTHPDWLDVMEQRAVGMRGGQLVTGFGG